MQTKRRTAYCSKSLTRTLEASLFVHRRTNNDASSIFHVDCFFDLEAMEFFKLGTH